MAWGLRGGGDQNSGTSASAQLNLAASDVPSIGDLLIAIIGVRNSDTVTMTVADNRGNTWTRAKRFATAGQTIEIWFAEATVGADTLITATLSGSQQWHIHGGAFFGEEATGLSVVSDGSDSASATTSHPCGTVTGIGLPSQIAITGSSVNNAFTPTENIAYVVLQTSSRLFSQYRPGQSTFSSDAVWTSVENVSTVSCQVVLAISPPIGPGPFRTRIGAIRIR